MNETKFSFTPIGTIHSPHKDIEGMPIQPGGAAGIKGQIEVLPEYEEGLQDLEGFSHVILLYVFHRVNGVSLTVTPFLDSKKHGVFATRAPKRPNPVGLSVVRLLGREGNMLQIENVDILDGTPLIDIKPYVPAFDAAGEVRTGWLQDHGKQVSDKKSDDRFRD